MFIFKNKYFLIIESIKDINLKNIKIRNKFLIIYRNKRITDEIIDLLKFRRICKLKAIKFFVANNVKLAKALSSDGVYLSSYNKDLKSLIYKKMNFEIIGSAHNFKEITHKIKQGCSSILLSKLFFVNYDKKAKILGLIKFNTISMFSKKLIPLGGINIKNINQLKHVAGQGLAILSEIKKKPAIISRLF